MKSNNVLQAHASESINLASQSVTGDAECYSVLSQLGFVSGVAPRSVASCWHRRAIPRNWFGPTIDVIDTGEPKLVACLWPWDQPTNRDPLSGMAGVGVARAAAPAGWSDGPLHWYVSFAPKDTKTVLGALQCALREVLAA
ncbi:MAG: hypothetical protein JSW10_05920 [Pseudomonadota bacterium]|nr:MAG: hypothetical protein JSW10_05920 [Pseudomonadota bacterium]